MSDPIIKVENPYVTVIIPVYNEEDCIRECILSLQNQDFKPLEILVIDDGSTDNSAKICEQMGMSVLRQHHRGPGAARNLGARRAMGDILVLVDADMLLEPDYISRLVRPIVNGDAVATCHWDEMVSNWSNPWARCHTYYLGLPARRRQPLAAPTEELVYRAVRKDFFLAAGGFAENEGRADDSSLAQRTGVKAKIVRDARCYHNNPASAKELLEDAMWHGRNAAAGKGNRWRASLRQVYAHNPLFALVRGVACGIRRREPHLPIYALIYSAGFIAGVVAGLLTKKYTK